MGTEAVPQGGTVRPDHGEPVLVPGIASSVGSVGDACDNALAETIVGLYKKTVLEQLEPRYSLARVNIKTHG